MAELIAQNDLQVIANSRLLEQFKNSTNLRALIELMIAQFTEVQVAIFDLMVAFDLEDAEGAQLDIIGRHVGLPRPSIDSGLFDYFGYQGAPGAKGYGSISAPEVGGVYLSKFGATSGLVAMTDTEYRAHIRAKIVRNRGNGTAEDMLEIIRLVIPSPGMTDISRTGELEITVIFGRALSTIEKAFFLVEDLNGFGDRLLPRGAGISINYEDTAGPF